MSRAEYQHIETVVVKYKTSVSPIIVLLACIRERQWDYQEIPGAHLSLTTFLPY